VSYFNQSGKFKPFIIIMKKIIFILFVQLFILQLSNAQSCNNWLFTPETASFVTVGDIDVSGDQLTVEALFTRTDTVDMRYRHPGVK
jgi:hypothetical protein